MQKVLDTKASRPDLTQKLKLIEWNTQADILKSIFFKLTDMGFTCHWYILVYFN